ncbi:hypothetical protein KAW50_06330 [candidate division WOR-3 bacterium]|nr:hypothetical protein [candidate division WOR-3 bacterium]
MKWEKAVIKEDKSIEIPVGWLDLHYYEALTILFRIENALRVFVFSVLKNEFQEKWCESIVSDDSDSGGTVESIAKKRIHQAKSFGYLGYSTTCPIMYLTSGELTRLITSEAYWKYFNEYFSGSKDIIKNKLDEIGNIRNSLSHFRPIKQDDVDLVKQNARHVLIVIEKCLLEMMTCKNVVPTNTTESWYKELNTVGTDNCTLSFFQSNDEQWIKINIKYNCPIISKSRLWSHHISYRVLNIISSNILTKYPLLASLLIYLSESNPSSYIEIKEDYSTDFRKNISLVFSKRILSKNYRKVKTQIAKLLEKISEETDLITQDNLARGEIVELINTDANFRKTEKENGYWWIGSADFLCDIREDDPPEYWGDFYLSTRDFVAGTNKYPWMPTTISKTEFPF